MSVRPWRFFPFSSLLPCKQCETNRWLKFKRAQMTDFYVSCVFWAALHNSGPQIQLTGSEKPLSWIKQQTSSHGSSDSYFTDPAFSSFNPPPPPTSTPFNDYYLCFGFSVPICGYLWADFRRVRVSNFPRSVFVHIPLSLDLRWNRYPVSQSRRSAVSHSRLNTSSRHQKHQAAPDKME